jgi:UDP-glucose 4-epimerase
MRAVDGCFHLASAVGVQLIVQEPLQSLLANVRGIDIVMSAAVEHRRRLLFTSTSEVYGKNSGGALHEMSDRILGPPSVSRWSYSTAKAFGEALLFGYCREQGAEMAAVRLFNTVGPRQASAYGMVLPRFVRQALAQEPLTVYGNGLQSRCFGHVADAVHAIGLVFDHDEAVGNVYNVGAPVELPIVELARRVIERAASTSTIRLVPYDEAYAPGFEELGRRKADTSSLRELTGWQATRTVEEAIDDVIAFETRDVQQELRLAG